MKIEFRLYASLSRYLPEEWRTSSTVEVREGITVRELLAAVKVPVDAVKVVFVNGVHTTGEEALNDGDRVGVFPPVAGG